MDISKLRVRIQSRNKKAKRVGRGTGSGHGMTSGRGDKGAGQHAKSKVPYLGYNGGNVPYARKFPKRGFHSPDATVYQIVNLGDIQEQLKGTAEINPETLKTGGLIKNEKRPVKILANNITGQMSLKATFKADKFSAKAKTLIETGGGKTEILKR